MKEALDEAQETAACADCKDQERAAGEAGGITRESDEYSLLQELLNKPTDQSGSHLDIPLDFIADSPTHVASLGKLGCCSHVLEQQVRQRLHKHKHELVASLRRDLESTGWGRTVLAATAERLSLFAKGIGDFEAALLARWAHASGSLGKLELLSLGNNQIGDPGISALAGAIASRSLGALKSLYLYDNQIGDAGMSALAGAIASGSLVLTALHLFGNEITDDGLALLFPLFKTKLSKLTAFSISSGITDNGMRLLSGEIASGSLGTLQQLRIDQNNIGDEGVKALAEAIASGSLPALSTVFIDDELGRHPQLKAACNARNVAVE